MTAAFALPFRAEHFLFFVCFVGLRQQHLVYAKNKQRKQQLWIKIHNLQNYNDAKGIQSAFTCNASASVHVTVGTSSTSRD